MFHPVNQTLCVPALRTEINTEHYERFSNIFDLAEISYKTKRHLVDCECSQHPWQRASGWLMDWESLGFFLDAVHPFVKNQIIDQFERINLLMLYKPYNVLHVKLDKDDFRHYHGRYNLDEAAYAEELKKCYLKLCQQYFDPALPLYIAGTHPHESIFADLLQLGYHPIAKPHIKLTFWEGAIPNEGRELNALAEELILDQLPPPKSMILNYGSTFSHWMAYRYRKSEVHLLDLEGPQLCTMRP